MKRGTAKAARIPRMTITTTSSMSVKPRCAVRIMDVTPKEDAEESYGCHLRHWLRGPPANSQRTVTQVVDECAGCDPPHGAPGQPVSDRRRPWRSCSTWAGKPRGRGSA